MAYSQKVKKDRKGHSYIIKPARIIKLPIEQDVIVPETKGINSQKRISRKERNRRVKEVRKYLASRYGGYTSVKATGGYVLNKNGKLVKEPVEEVISFASEEDYKLHKKETKKQIFEWGNEWGQESVSYIKDGHLYLYEPEQKIKVHK